MPAIPGLRHAPRRSPYRRSRCDFRLGSAEHRMGSHERDRAFHRVIDVAPMPERSSKPGLIGVIERVSTGTKLVPLWRPRDHIAVRPWTAQVE